MKIPILKCKRCEHKWYPRSANLPKVCGKCKSPYWNRERLRNKIVDIKVHTKDEEGVQL